MKKFFLFILVFVLLASTANAGIDEMRENGTLLLMFVVGVFIVFFSFCLVVLIVASATEKKLGRKNKPDKKPKHPQSPEMPEMPMSFDKFKETADILRQNRRNRAYS